MSWRQEKTRKAFEDLEYRARADKSRESYRECVVGMWNMHAHARRVSIRANEKSITSSTTLLT
jgi:hypothetical protein